MAELSGYICESCNSWHSETYKKNGSQKIDADDYAQL